MTGNANGPQVQQSPGDRKDLAAGERSTPTVAQTSGRWEVRATPGWPPVAIPGRPGWWRHHINGQQVDLPTREAPAQGRGDGQ